MNTTDFLPEVWTSPGWPAMLVCGRNWMHSAPMKGANIPTTFSRINHAVAIQLLAPPVICFNFYGGGENSTEVWTRHAPETVGLPTRAAALALAEVWRVIDMKQSHPSRDVQAHADLKKLSGFRDGAIRRNILIWLAWGQWQAEGATFEKRRLDIEAHGFKLSEKAFKRLLENAGMSI